MRRWLWGHSPCPQRCPSCVPRCHPSLLRTPPASPHIPGMSGIPQGMAPLPRLPQLQGLGWDCWGCAGPGAGPGDPCGSPPARDILEFCGGSGDFIPKLWLGSGVAAPPWEAGLSLRRKCQKPAGRISPLPSHFPACPPALEPPLCVFVALGWAGQGNQGELL